MKAIVESAEVAEIAQECIATWHPHLSILQIGYYEADLPGSPPSPPAKTKRMSAFERVISGGLVAAIIVDAAVWAMSDETTRRALIDHELSHLAVKEGEIAMRRHDVEEFAAVYKRHGAWNKELQRFVAPDEKE